MGTSGGWWEAEGWRERKLQKDLEGDSRIVILAGLVPLES